ncbi:Hypothetical protein A7982_02791 [Minicystis rosea]|nr:Hypothetical protein A7982_02791 [Minicystis rosea]
MLEELVQRPIGYFLVMVVVLSAASQSPVPATLMAVKHHPPLVLATLAAVAGAIAAVFDWVLVRRVFQIGMLARARAHPMFERAERWAKVAPFFTVVLFAALPLPFMCPRVLMPLTGYPWPRYAAAVAIGRFPRIFVIATFGQVIDVPAWVLEAFFAGGVLVAVITAIARKLGWFGGPVQPSEEAKTEEATPNEVKREDAKPEEAKPEDAGPPPQA